MSNIDLTKIKPTDNLLDAMINVKEEHLLGVSLEYGVEATELYRILKELLMESNGNLAVCNTAVDFLIININEKKHNKNLREEIRANILNSAIYYANVLNMDVN